MQPFTASPAWALTSRGDRERSVLLIHGMSSSRRTWWRVGPDLEARGWDVGTVDLAGHGGRSIGAVRSVAALAEDVVAQHPACPTLVVGHSLGAIVALELVAAMPTYARGLVLEDPPALSARRGTGDIAGDIEREVMRARADPHSAIEAMLAGHPRWNRRDARSMLEGRLMTDPQVAQLSPTTSPGTCLPWSRRARCRWPSWRPWAGVGAARARPQRAASAAAARAGD